MVARSAACLWAICGALLSCLTFDLHELQAQNAYGQSLAGSNSPLNFYGEGCVLLQHGAVIQGFIKPQADSVRVVMDKGKQVTLVKKQILFIGPTVESLYKYQTRAVRKWGTGEHWHLAQWCIQNGLLDHAIEHYLELEKQAADNPKFKQLDLQLKQALLADERVRLAMAKQGIEPPKHDFEEKSSDAPLSKSEVIQASATEPAFPVHTVPGYLRRSFQTEITPIVVSRCGQSGCHGILTKNTFQVFQPVGQQAASINERNLENVLRFIDATAPEESDLLHYAARPHGAQRNASFNLQREEDRLHLERLAKWIQSLESIKPKTKSLDQPGPVIQAVTTATAQDASSVQQAIATSPKLSRAPKSGYGAVAIDATDLAEIQEEIRKLERLAKTKSKVVDPFDAKIFNSKHGKVDPNAELPPSKQSPQ